MQRGKRPPYLKLGKRLLEIRKGLNETLPEVSGAVELDVDIIDSYEKGETRPSEEVLDMLISHFDVKDDEADELWYLAGYEETDDMAQGHAMDMSGAPTNMPMIPTIVVMPIENKILYTDKVNVSVNQQGLVMGFMQESANPGQSVPVSRVGMSVEHAKKMIEVLNTAIDKFENNKPKTRN